MEKDMVICIHMEVIDSRTNIGKCRICGQERRYDPERRGEVRLIKRGRIEGTLTMAEPPRLSELAHKEAKAAPAEAIGKEEDIMVETKGTVEEVPAPPKPRKRKQIREYYEQNKEAILADYQVLKTRDFLVKWSISPATWAKLKKLWEVKSKRPSSPPPAETPSSDDSQCLTEHERYLVLVGYQQAVREFLQSGKY